MLFWKWNDVGAGGMDHSFERSATSVSPHVGVGRVVGDGSRAWRPDVPAAILNRMEFGVSPEELGLLIHTLANPKVQNVEKDTWVDRNNKRSMPCGDWGEGVHDALAVFCTLFIIIFCTETRSVGRGEEFGIALPSCPLFKQDWATLCWIL